MPVAALDRLAERAETLAGAWGARARATTTVGQERAILRLFGVTGLDRAGRPLAGAAVDRWLSTARDGLGGGIALPFAMALLEYDLEPQQLALDVASGAVDLALEAELLHEPDRRAVAEAEARRLAGVAIERIDADRIARRELEDLLGEATRPWLGTTLTEPDLSGALDEVVALATAGFDVLRVEVPIGRELADRLHDAGQDVPEWQPRDRPDGDRRRPPRLASRRRPASRPRPGSQRALGRLRRVADGVAAERRGYVRLATAIPALGVPEGAVVAAFERVDLVEADPMAEIVGPGVDPDRSLADHAFARRLHRRADTLVAIGPGPLVVAPDLARGQPADAATRSGRALALQLARRRPGPGGRASPPIGSSSGPYPAWLLDEPSATARVLGEVAVRRHLYADHLLRFDEGAGDGIGAGRRRRLAVHRRGRAGPDRRRTPSSCAGPTATTDATPPRAGRRRGSRPSWLGIAPPGSLGGLAAAHAAAVVDGRPGDPGHPGRSRLAAARRPAVAAATPSVGARPRRRRRRRADRGVRPARRD